MKIVLTGGGTGGHTTPLLAMIDYFNDSNIDAQFLYIGTRKGIEAQLAASKGIPFKAIASGKLRRYLSIRNFIDIFKTLFGILQSFFILLSFRPWIVFSTGGFVSVPVVISSWILRRKIIIHEQTANVGLANRIASRFANKICLSFESSASYFPQNKVISTGQPLRKDFYEAKPEAVYERFSFERNRAIIYVTGGSQGSHLINQCIKSILPKLLDKYQIIHQCGKHESHRDEEDLNEEKTKLAEKLQQRYVVQAFIMDGVADIMASASLLIGRSGAGTVHEVAHFELPSIFIPLKIATKNEQFHNAKTIADKGFAEIILEDDLSPESLYNSIDSMLSKTVSKGNSTHQTNQKDAREAIFEVLVSTLPKP